jgi:septal ring factor EnvC (AmiA/AmiB activator)
MPRLEEINQTNQNKPTNTNQTENCGFETKTNPPSNQNLNQKPSGLMTIIGQLLPLAPFAFEQFTGQKVPAMTGTMAEIQTVLMQIQTGMQTIANNQQSLNQRLISLESSATNLTHQFKNLRLTHTKEQKQLEYNNSSHLEEENQNY